MNELVGVNERLKEVRKTLKLTQEKFAKGLGATLRAVQNYEAQSKTNRRNVPIEILDAALKTFKVNPAWLLTGEGDMFIDKNINVIKDQEKDYYKIPIYNVKAAAGSGYINEPEKIEGSLCFKRQWVQTVLLTLPENLFIIQVSGDSMEPTFRDGDIIAGDKSKIYDKQDGIYVIRRGDELMVKRLQFLNGKYRVLSDNTLYPPYETKDIALIGKVVWFGRKLS